MKFLINQGASFVSLLPSPFARDHRKSHPDNNAYRIVTGCTRMSVNGSVNI